VIANVTDAIGRVWTFQSDPNNHITGIIQPNGCQTQFTYGAFANQLTSVQDPMGYLTSFVYATTTSPQPSQVQAGTATWTYTFGTSANVMEEPSGALTTYTLDTGTGVVSSVYHERATSAPSPTIRPPIAR